MSDRFMFNEPYDSSGLEPQQIRDDFVELINTKDPTALLYALSSWLPTDTQAEFLDDCAMGRV